MYLVQIEPVYFQGVGNFEMITDNVENIELFRNELVRYKNYLTKIDFDDLEHWEFFETIYKLVDFDVNKTTFSGYCISNMCYDGDFEKLIENVDYLCEGKIEIVNFEYDVPFKIDHVNNNIDSSVKPIHINDFDIVGKNYLKE